MLDDSGRDLIYSRRKVVPRQDDAKRAGVRNLDTVFAELSHSKFRRQFRLRAPELDYLRRKGMPEILDHAARFIRERLAPAFPSNDGKQTPYRNHPVFVAQHATATCCRGCLEKWHAIQKGKELTAEEQAHALRAVERWLLAWSEGEHANP